MNLPPNQPTPTKPKLTAGSYHTRQADRLATIRLRMAIWGALGKRDITGPAAIGAALGMPVAEAAKLLTGARWREGDVAQLEAAAAWLGVDVLPSLPAKLMQSTEARRIRQADRLATIRLRMAIWRHLDDRGITMPAAIAAAVGMPPAEAAKLLTGRQWRPDGVALLEAVAARLGVKAPDD